MNTNEKLIHHFYSSFQKKDYKAMQECYSEKAIFSDDVFIRLNSQQVKAMWEMFCKKGQNLSIHFSNIKADEKTGMAEWTAHYTFSATGKKVVNYIRANFIFENNKIVAHTDSFSFYKWAKQALGITGLLFSWTPFLQNKVRKQAMKNLTRFMKKNNSI